MKELEDLRRWVQKEISETYKQLKKLDDRVSKIERDIYAKKIKVKPKAQDFKGLIGGIRLLISNGFLDSPKNVKEIREELKREGYHYSYQSVDKILRVDFLAKRRILTRIKDNNIWKYVLRK